MSRFRGAELLHLAQHDIGIMTLPEIRQRVRERIAGETDAVSLTDAESLAVANMVAARFMSEMAAEDAFAERMEHDA